MKLDRRTFIKSTMSSSAAILLTPEFEYLAKETIKLPAPMTLKIMATNWGFEGTMDQFCAKVKTSGYDGIEIVFPWDQKARTEMLEAVKKHSLDYAFLIQTGGDTPEDHLKSFEEVLKVAIATKPLYINCHAGKDFFSYEQNKGFIDLTNKLQNELKVPLYHETHRGRILYSAPLSKNFIDKEPSLRLTLDISHWCAVHESMLSDQSATIDSALKRTEHIHARVGHPEGPQVNDPRAPEWKSALESHLGWWDKVVANKVAAGATLMTFLTEFGPVDYMPAIPYTRQPVANQWDINVFMMQLLRKRYVK